MHLSNLRNYGETVGHSVAPSHCHVRTSWMVVGTALTMSLRGWGHAGCMHSLLLTPLAKRFHALSHTKLGFVWTNAWTAACTSRKQILLSQEAPRPKHIDFSVKEHPTDLRIASRGAQRSQQVHWRKPAPGLQQVTNSKKPEEEPKAQPTVLAPEATVPWIVSKAF